MRNRLYTFFLCLIALFAGCTRGLWLDEIENKRNEQAAVIPILLDAYDKGLLVTSVEVVERTDKYLHHSEYDHRYRLTFYDDTVVEIERGHPSDDKFYEKRGQAYIREILTSGERGVEFFVWLPNEEWRQKYDHLVCEDGETVRFYLRIRDDDVLSKIYYTSTDGEIVTPYATDVFGSNSEGYEAIIVSNTYENGQGVITFVGEVTKIGDLAFYNCSSIASITIPDSVSVTSIGRGAFERCRSLASVTIPDSVTEIGDAAFNSCDSLASITIPDSVTSIGESAFLNCWNLASVTIGNGVTSIDWHAFNGCSITDVYISDIAAWCGISFSDIYANPLGLANNLYLNGELVTDLVIPDSVTSIGDYAFRKYSNLASVTIPDSVTSIGSYAFYACSSLVSVYCKATTPPTGSSYMFDNNASGRTIYVPEESVEAYKTTHYWSNYAADIVGYDFENGEMVEEEIPETWKIYYTSNDGNIIQPNTYYNSTFGANIVSNTYENGQGIIIFDGEVTNIYDKAFRFNKNLTNISIPSSVTSIGSSAFTGCANLTSITIPEGVTSIGNEAFSGCSCFTSIYIPESVTSIGPSAFTGCSNLVEFNGKFASEDGMCLIVGGVLNSFAIGCDLTEYTIPDGVTSIGDSAFCYCKSLASVTIGNGVTSIGDSAFRECSSLASITIPGSVTSIGDWAFSNCSSLASITIPDSVTSIGQGAFSNCSSLTSVTIPESVTFIGESAFSDCLSIAEFNGKFTSEDGKCLIVDGELRLFALGCGLTEYIIPNGVTSIKVGAFGSCKSLTSVTIPEGITSIDYQAFNGCTSLKWVYCKPTTPPTGSSYMFDNNASGRKIYVPEESVEAYKAAKRWSDYAADIVGYSF